MVKVIYLVKAKGYCYIFSNGRKSICVETINYHCCTSLEEAKNDVRRWQKEDRIQNQKAAKEGKLQIWHNYQIETLDLY